MSNEKKTDLSAVHAVNLKLLSEIDRICRKYKIRYSLDSGTLLGAVRHRGFIPWDDDVDVVFTRSQYEMFAKVVRRELPFGMTFVEPDEYHSGKAFFDFVPRITYDQSCRYEDSEKTEFYDDKISRLCVDIFILDALPEGKLGKAWTKIHYCLIYGLALGHRWKIDYSDYHGIAKLAVRMLSSVGKMISFRRIYRMYRKTAMSSMRKNTNLYFYSNYAPNWYYVETRKEWSQHMKEVPFECRKFMITSGYEQVLTQLYGDFMKLPPEDKQIPEHSDMEIKIYG